MYEQRVATHLSTSITTSFSDSLCFRYDRLNSFHCNVMSSFAVEYPYPGRSTNMMLDGVPTCGAVSAYVAMGADYLVKVYLSGGARVILDGANSEPSAYGINETGFPGVGTPIEGHLCI